MITACSSWTWWRVIGMFSQALTEIHISSIGLRTNEIMRMLTVIIGDLHPADFHCGSLRDELHPYAGVGETVGLLRLPSDDADHRGRRRFSISRNDAGSRALSSGSTPPATTGASIMALCHLPRPCRNIWSSARVVTPTARAERWGGSRFGICRRRRQIVTGSIWPRWVCPCAMRMPVMRIRRRKN